MALRWQRAAYWLIVIAIAGTLLYFSLRGIEWSQVWQIVQGARPGWVLLSMAMTTAALLLRSLRWRVLLSAHSPVPPATTFWATTAGYLGNNVLPARAGEMIRTLMISRRTGANMAFVLTTALSERVVDAAVLVSTIPIVLLILPAKPEWLESTVRPFAAVGMTSVLGLALLPYCKDSALRLLAWLPLPEAISSRLANIAGQVITGVEAFHHKGRLAQFLLFTGVVWFLDASITTVVAKAIGILISLPLAFLLVASLGLSSALPSTPGYVGIYQFVAVTVLTPFGTSRPEAVAYILLLQAMNYLVVGLWGGIGLTRVPFRA